LLDQAQYLLFLLGQLCLVLLVLLDQLLHEDFGLLEVLLALEQLLLQDQLLFLQSDDGLLVFVEYFLFGLDFILPLVDESYQLLVFYLYLAQSLLEAL
jgi:hypothetical protein